MKSTMWEDEYQKFIASKQPIQGLLIEASTDPSIKEILPAAQTLAPEKHLNQLIKHRGRYISLSSKEFFDYKATRDGSAKGIGFVTSWHDATELVDRYNAINYRNLLYGIFAFIIIELLIFLGLRFGTKQLRLTIKEQTTALEEQNLKLDQFNRSVSHDLKTPVSAVLGLAELANLSLAESPDSPLKKDMLVYWENAQKAARQANNLIESLLSYAKKGLAGVPIEECLLEEIFLESEKVLSMQIQKSGAAITKTGTNIKVRASKPLMVQVFTNLFSNSIKYGKENVPVKIEVCASLENKKIKIEVSDNGRGIAKDEIDKIFVGFYRTKDSLRDVDGHGVGLETVKRLIEDHGGEIFVKSQLGQGTTFTIFLPA